MKNIFKVGFHLAWIYLLLPISTATAYENVLSQKENLYVNSDIGWTLKVPNHWNVVSEKKLNELDEIGHEAIEKTIEKNIDYSQLKHLISFNKNQFNIFQSTIEPFDVEYEGQWEDSNANVKEVMLETYKNHGLVAVPTETSIEKIDGLDFQKFEITIYTANGDLVINQLLYSRLINGFDFGVGITSNNPTDKNIMLETFRNSRLQTDNNER